GDVPALMPMAKATKNRGGSWFNVAHNTTSGHGQNPDGRKVGGDGFFQNGHPWMIARRGPGTLKRKAASALIAKIPMLLSQHIAASWKPMQHRTSTCLKTESHT